MLGRTSPFKDMDRSIELSQQILRMDEPHDYNSQNNLLSNQGHPQTPEYIRPDGQFRDMDEDEISNEDLQKYKTLVKRSNRQSFNPSKDQLLYGVAPTWMQTDAGG